MYFHQSSSSQAGAIVSPGVLFNTQLRFFRPHHPSWILQSGVESQTIDHRPLSRQIFFSVVKIFLPDMRSMNANTVSIFMFSKLSPLCYSQVESLISKKKRLREVVSLGVP